jgi:hypothetical protein
MTPYMMVRTDRIAAGPFSIPDWGLECPDFIAQKQSRLESDEHPDPKNPSWRKFSGTLEIEAGQPPRPFSVTVDESKCWAIVEFQFANPGAKTTYKFRYGENAGKIPKLTKLEMHADVEGKRSGIAGEYRITEIKFEAPKEETFGPRWIAADAAEEGTSNGGQLVAAGGCIKSLYTE